MLSPPAPPTSNTTLPGPQHSWPESALGDDGDEKGVEFRVGNENDSEVEAITSGPKQRISIPVGDMNMIAKPSASMIAKPSASARISRQKRTSEGDFVAVCGAGQV